MVAAIASPSDDPLHRGDRAHPRARLNVPARIVTFNGSFACSVIDLSRTGGKIVSEEVPRVGAMVVIEGLPLELFGTVRWRTSGSFGFEFDVPMSIDDVIALRHHAEGETERQRNAEISYVRTWVQGPGGSQR